MTSEASGNQAATSPAAWFSMSTEQRVTELRRLRSRIAELTLAHTLAYADAYLEGERQNLAGMREQTAKKKAATERRDLDLALADLGAFQLMIDMERWAALGE